MEKQSEQPPKSHRGIRYWSGAILLEELSEFQDILRELLSGEGRKGLYFERLATGNKKLKLYSVRINQEMRLLLTEQEIDGENILIALAVTRHYKGWENDAENIRKISTYLKQIDKSFVSLDSLQAEPIADEAQQDFLTSLIESKPSPVCYFSGNFLSLKADQIEAGRMRLPGLLLGMPGTGKTVTAVECLQSLQQQYPGAELYYASNHAGLVSDVAQTWAVQCPHLAANFTPLETLFAKFFTAIPKQESRAGIWTLADFMAQQDKIKKEKAKRNQKHTGQVFGMLEKNLASEKIYELLQLLALHELHASPTIAEYLERESGLGLDVLKADLRLYRAHLVEKKCYDLGISPLPTLLAQSSSSSELLLVLDEAQNVAPALLHLLVQVFGNRILAVGDPYQALAYQPMDRIWHALFREPDCRILNQSLRCPAPVVSVAQQLLGLMHVVGGEHIKGYGGYGAMPEIGADTLRGLFEPPKDFTTFRVIYAKPEQRSAAEKLYAGRALLFSSIEEVAGLTFERVALYGFLDDKCLSELTEPHYEAAARARLGHNPGKNAERKANVEAWLHRFLVGMTRCTKQLYLGCSGKTKSQQRFMQYLGITPNTQKTLQTAFGDGIALGENQKLHYSEEAFVAIEEGLKALVLSGAKHMVERDITSLIKSKRLNRGQVNRLEKLLIDAPGAEACVRARPAAPAKKTPIMTVLEKRSPEPQNSEDRGAGQFWESQIAQEPGILFDDKMQEKLFFADNADTLLYPSVQRLLKKVLANPQSYPAVLLAELANKALNKVIQYYRSPIDVKIVNGQRRKPNDYLWLFKLHIHTSRCPDATLEKIMQNFLKELMRANLGLKCGAPLYVLSSSKIGDDTSLLYCMLACCVKHGGSFNHYLLELFDLLAWYYMGEHKKNTLALQVWFDTLAELKENMPENKAFSEFERLLLTRFPEKKWASLAKKTPISEAVIKSLPLYFFTRYLPVFWVNPETKQRFLANDAAMSAAKEAFMHAGEDLADFSAMHPDICYAVERYGAHAKEFYVPSRYLLDIEGKLESLQNDTTDKTAVLGSLFSPENRLWIWGIMHNQAINLNETILSDTSKKRYSSLTSELIRCAQQEIYYRGGKSKIPVWQALLDLEPLLASEALGTHQAMISIQSMLLFAISPQDAGFLVQGFDQKPLETQTAIACMFYQQAIISMSRKYRSIEMQFILRAALAMVRKDYSSAQIEQVVSEALKMLGKFLRLMQTIDTSKEMSSGALMSAEGYIMRRKQLLHSANPSDCAVTVNEILKAANAARVPVDPRYTALMVLAYEIILSGKVPEVDDTKAMRLLEERELLLPTLVYTIENQYLVTPPGEQPIGRIYHHLFKKLSYEQIFHTELYYFGSKMTLADWAFREPGGYLFTWMKRNKEAFYQAVSTGLEQKYLKPYVLVFMFQNYLLFSDILLPFVKKYPTLCASMTEQDILDCNIWKGISLVRFTTEPCNRAAVDKAFDAAVELLKLHPEQEKMLGATTGIGFFDKAPSIGAPSQQDSVSHYLGKGM